MPDAKLIQTQIDEAKTRLQSRILLDAEGVGDPRVKRLVSRIGRDVFKKTFSLTRLRRDPEIGAEGFDAFRKIFGKLPKAYVADGKIAEALRLLRETDVKHSLIARVAGYRFPQTFRQEIKRRTGQTPSQIREAARRAGRLEQKRCTVLRDAPCANTAAWATWDALREETPEVQLAICFNEIRAESPALFHVLGEASRIEGREDRRRGVGISELALKHLEANAASFGGEAGELWAVGKARLGNALRLALDFTSAKEAFDEADKAWDELGGRGSPLAEAEIALLKGCFKMFRGDLGDALDLSNRAIALARSFGGGELLVRGVVQRVSVLGMRDEAEKTIPALRELLRLADEQVDRRLRFVANADLAIASTESGDFEGAREALLRARSDLDQALPLERWQLDWTEGLLLRFQDDLEAAGQKLNAAYAGMTEMGERGHAAVIGVDLAIVADLQGRSSDVLRLASEAIPVLAGFDRHEDAQAALDLLRKAIADDNVTVVVLGVVRKALRRGLHDPAISARA